MSLSYRAAALAAALGCGGTDQTAAQPPGASGAEQDSAGTDSAAAQNYPAAHGAAAESAPTDGSGESAVGAPGATYSVPVPAELEAYATFELGDLRFRERGNEWTLDYSLPPLLVGGTRQVSFRGVVSSSSAYELSGDAGSMTCVDQADVLVCDEMLTAIELDRDKLERAFADLPAAESRARWEVANRFADDPIGVLRIARR